MKRYCNMDICQWGSVQVQLPVNVHFERVGQIRERANGNTFKWNRIKSESLTQVWKWKCECNAGEVQFVQFAKSECGCVYDQELQQQAGAPSLLHPLECQILNRLEQREVAIWSLKEQHHSHMCPYHYYYISTVLDMCSVQHCAVKIKCDWNCTTVDRCWWLALAQPPNLSQHTSIFHIPDNKEI